MPFGALIGVSKISVTLQSNCAWRIAGIADEVSSKAGPVENDFAGFAGNHRGEAFFELAI
jgi:hypothetical protein